MATVLYRKYRPQSFEDVVGQEHITRTLSAAIATGRVAHAYLFSGPRGVGKTTTARLLAKSVNCTSSPRHSEKLSDEESHANQEPKTSQVIPCNTCDLCKEITAGRCVDVVEMDAASHTQVDHVREHIIDTARIVPARALRKVYIIDEVHMLSNASFNALLKTIEEPPTHVHFILATTELHKVPDTIRSRCQHFSFRRVSPDVLRGRLRTLVTSEGVQVEDGVLEQIVRAADGSVRDAESLLGQVCALGGDTITTQDAALVLPRSSVDRAQALIDTVMRCSVAEMLTMIDSIEADGFDAEAFLRDCIIVLRDAVHLAAQQGTVQGVHISMLRMCTELLDRVGRDDRPFFLIEVALLTLIARTQSVSANGSFSQKVPMTVPSQAIASNPKGELPTNPPTTQGQRQAVAAVSHDAEQPENARDHDDSSPTPTNEQPPPPKVEARGEPPDAACATVEVAAGADEALFRIRQQWTQLAQQLAKTNHSLPYLLEGGRPQAIIGSVLTIAFRFKLHAEKIRQPGTMDIVSEGVSQCVGRTLRIETVVISNEEFEQLAALTRPETGDTVADAALEVFGGMVVD